MLGTEPSLFFLSEITSSVKFKAEQTAPSLPKASNHCKHEVVPRFFQRSFQISYLVPAKIPNLAVVQNQQRRVPKTAEMTLLFPLIF